MSERLAQVKDSVAEGKENLLKNMKNTTDTVVENLDHQMDILGERFETLSADVRDRLRGIDDHMHQKPYLYLAAAGALGLGLGFLLKAKASNKS